MLGTDKEEKTKSWATFSYGLIYIDTPVLVDQRKLTFISFAQLLVVMEGLGKYREDLTISMDGKKEPRESKLSTCLDYF